MLKFSAVILMALLAACSATSSQSNNDKTASSTPIPRPIPTLARDGSSFPLTDLPRKFSDGSLIDIDAAATGVVDPDHNYIAVTPMNDGGSGGPTRVAWYGLRNHKPFFLGVRIVGTSVDNLAIHNGRLTLRVRWYDPQKHSAHCCPDGYQVQTYALLNQRLTTAAPPLVVRTDAAGPPIVKTSSRPEGAVDDRPSRLPPREASRIRRLPEVTAGSDCSNESIETVAGDGSFIAILGGGHYLVDVADRVDTTLWLATDDVIVCDEGYDVKLIHDNEVAHGHRIR